MSSPRGFTQPYYAKLQFQKKNQIQQCRRISGLSILMRLASINRSRPSGGWYTKLPLPSLKGIMQNYPSKSRQKKEKKNSNARSATPSTSCIIAGPKPAPAPRTGSCLRFRPKSCLRVQNALLGYCLARVKAERGVGPKSALVVVVWRVISLDSLIAVWGAGVSLARAFEGRRDERKDNTGD
jgi:hypothetical protein